MKLVITMTSYDGAVYFWSGEHWSVEYPSAKVFTTPVRTKREAETLAFANRKEVTVIRDYGLESQQMFYRARPPRDPVKEAELAKAVTEKQKEIAAKQKLVKDEQDRRVLAYENAAAEVKAAEKVLVDAVMAGRHWMCSAGWAVGAPVNDAVERLEDAREKFTAVKVKEGLEK